MTKALVGYPTFDGFEGVLIHSQGSPQHAGEQIRQIVCREGDLIAIDCLCDLAGGWMFISAQDGSGFGVEERGTGIFKSSRPEYEIEWAYVIYHEQIAIYRMIGYSWRMVVRLPLSTPIDEKMVERIDAESEIIFDRVIGEIFS